MSFLDAWRHRLSVLLKGNSYDDEVRREMAFHRELDGAGANAFGNATYYREEVRHTTLLAWTDRLKQDATYAIRGVRRSPGLTVAVTLTLGFGVGATAAMLSLLDRVLLQPPAGITRPNELRRLYTDDANPASGRLVWPTTQYARFHALANAIGDRIPFAGFTNPDSIDIRTSNARLTGRRSFVTPRYFDVLGIRAARGRLFVDNESDIGVPARVAVVSDAFARRAFVNRWNALGQSVSIAGNAFTIVGIAPSNFTGVDLDAVDVWLPANNYPPRPDLPSIPWYQLDFSVWNMVARVTDPSGEADLVATGTNAIRAVAVPGYSYDSTTRVRPGPIVLGAGPMALSRDMNVLIRVAGVAAIVLLIAWANVLNLLLLRSSQRAREIAVRRALGVSRRRLMGQLVIEALAFAICGAVLAGAVAYWVGGIVRHLVLPRVQWPTGPVDARTLLFIGGATFVIALVGGVLSAVQSLSFDVLESLKVGAHSTARRGNRLREALLVLQIALCVMLVVGAGLFIRSLDAVQSIGVGYAIDDRIFLRPGFDDPRAHAAELATAFPEAARRLATVPGVVSVAYSATPPLQGATYQTIFVPGRDSLPRLQGDIGPSFNRVSAGFFRTMGLPFRSGRDFSAADSRESAPVAIISESMARAYWPSESALGKCFSLLKRENPCVTVVGVVADAHRYMMLEGRVMQFFLPLSQSGASARDLIIHVAPGASSRVVREADVVFRGLVTNMLDVRWRTIESVLEPQLRQWRLGVTLIGALALLALLVSAVGVYSVVAYAASQRTKEIGVRIALGARRENVLDLIVGDGMKAVGIGLVLGVAGTLIAGRLIAAMLFGVTPTDPGVLIAAMTTLSAVGIAGCLIPAFRAASTDPMHALRSE
jgi:predicted permease